MNQKDLNDLLGSGLLFLLNVLAAEKPRRQRLRMRCFPPHFQKAAHIQLAPQSAETNFPPSFYPKLWAQTEADERTSTMQL